MLLRNVQSELGACFVGMFLLLGFVFCFVYKMCFWYNVAKAYCINLRAMKFEKCTEGYVGCGCYLFKYKHWKTDLHPYEGRKEMFYLTTHSTHFIYGYMESDIWLRTTQIVSEETRCRHMGYSFRLAARDILYASSHRQDNTYHGLCYSSRGALAGTRNSSMGPPWRIDPTIHRTMSERSYHRTTSCWWLMISPALKHRLLR